MSAAFFNPVPLNFELADLLIQLGFEGFIRLLIGGWSLGEKVRRVLLQLTFPLAQLRRIHLVFTR